MAGVKRTFGAMMGRETSVMPFPIATNDATPPLTSADTVTRTPSPTFPPLSGRVPSFGQDASLVLVGIRGSGKSTLAVMAGSAMKRKVIDLEIAFQRATGSSSAAYKKLNGSQQCHRQQAKVLQNILERNRTGCVVICSWMERRIQALLRDFTASNPVIHITRDAEAIGQHLSIRDAEKIQSLLAVSNAIFRACSNFEFFNVSEKRNETPSPSDGRADPRSTAPSLTLKQAERHLLRFLSQVYPAGTIPFVEPAFPLASIPVEKRRYTYALTVALSDVISGTFKIEDHDSGADVVELFVTDLGTGSPDAGTGTQSDTATCITQGIGIIRRASVLPISVHITLPQHTREESVQAYLELLTHTLRSAPSIVTLDLRLDDGDIARVMSAKGLSKVMGHLCLAENPPSWLSPTWTSWYRRARVSGCDFVRLLRPANHLEDNFEVSRLHATISSLDERERIPLVAYNLGKLGRHSAFLNPIMTRVTPSSWASPRSSEAWQPSLTAADATRALFSSFMYDAMKLYVIGHKVDYSLSPAMHNTALEECGIPHRYRPFTSTSLAQIRHVIEDPHFGGSSISQPFKVEIITLTHSLSPHAQAIGAVNTLIPIRNLEADGSIPSGPELFRGVSNAGPVKALYGENTDWTGIRACIRKGLSPANAVKAGTCGIIVGAGGMARAATYAMLQVGVSKIAIYNRTVEKAESMAAHFRRLLQKESFQGLGAGAHTEFRVLRSLENTWPSDLRLPTILISCIPTLAIGNAPAPNFSAPEAWLQNPTGGVIVELDYKTPDSPLLQQARSKASKGWVPMDGLDLLPEQGFAQFEFFTGRRAPRKVMTRGLYQAYIEQQARSDIDELQPKLRSITET